ncbi:hypothetical protein K435DRAFT_876483 [Dendrothele bispora CBS 962.96]|uniref:Uncharacterized protein n=1 Tax=Dendrothele bispora (strain CBS 962.96) TaxID=1314807 RepID=A0A4S8KT42_DENBC|nr:hypothetical protein K435DRAFT_876483 [Dendrothele bispora CBS 962.96]
MQSRKDQRICKLTKTIDLWPPPTSWWSFPPSLALSLPPPCWFFRSSLALSSPPLGLPCLLAEPLARTPANNSSLYPPRTKGCCTRPSRLLALSSPPLALPCLKFAEPLAGSSRTPANTSSLYLPRTKGCCTRPSRLLALSLPPLGLPCLLALVTLGRSSPPGGLSWSPLLALGFAFAVPPSTTRSPYAEPPAHFFSSARSQFTSSTCSQSQLTSSTCSQFQFASSTCSRTTCSQFTSSVCFRLNFTSSAGDSRSFSSSSSWWSELVSSTCFRFCFCGPSFKFNLGSVADGQAHGTG